MLIDEDEWRRPANLWCLGLPLTVNHVTLKYNKIFKDDPNFGTSLKILLWSVLLRIFQSVHIHTIVHFVPKFMKVPVVAEVGVVVTVVSVLAVGVVNVVGELVLSVTRTHMRLHYSSCCY